MAVNVDSLNIDWKKWMSFYATPDAGLETANEEWVEEMCRTAADIIFHTIPIAYTRYQDKLLSERVLAYVACSMVLRVADPGIHIESNGTYSVTRDSPQANPPGFSSARDLFVSKKERALLEGTTEGRTPVGTLGMSVNRYWGR